MAKILVAFFNCMNDPENPNAMPIFWRGIYQRIGSGWEIRSLHFHMACLEWILGDRIQ